MQLAIRRVKQTNVHASNRILRIASEVLICRRSEVLVHLAERSEGTIEIYGAVGTRRRETNRSKPVRVLEALSTRRGEERLPTGQWDVGADERLSAHNRCLPDWAVENLRIGSADPFFNHTTESIVGE